METRWQKCNKCGYSSSSKRNSCVNCNEPFMNQEPTRECCEKCRAYARTNEDLTSYVVPTCIDKQCPFCHSIKPPVEDKCYSCGGKGYYTQMYGEVGSDDFVGGGYEISPTIHKKPCSACKGTGKKLKQEDKEECKGCKKYFMDCICELSPELSWEEEFDEKIKVPWGNHSNLGIEIKAFIKSQKEKSFNSGRASIVEIIEGMKKRKNGLKHFGGNGYFNQQGYNQALDDILQALKNKETKE